MQIVVEIDDELYEIIKNPKKLETIYHAGRLCEAVRNGIILPDNHGDLIDRDVLMDIYKRKVYIDFVKQVEIAKAVVKGNKM